MELSQDRSESIALIRGSAVAIAARDGDYARVRAVRYRQPGHDRSVWKTVAELGWLGLRVAEASGGTGLGALEFRALLEELGRRLTPEPLLEVICAARWLKGEALAGVLDGSRIVVPAWQERENQLDSTSETKFVNGKLIGRKIFVASAEGADGFLVTTADGLVFVEVGASGVTIESLMRQDGGTFGTVTFDGAPAEALEGDAGELVDDLALGAAAYLLGVMERCFEMTLDYLKVREQFGKKIGTYQVLQHRIVDMKIQLELTRTVIDAAAAAADGDASAAHKRAMVSRAKARAADAAMTITRHAIQMHGGIGYTDEADPGLFLRKAMTLQNLYGSPSLHRARFAALAPETRDSQ